MLGRLDAGPVEQRRERGRSVRGLVNFVKGVAEIGEVLASLGSTASSIDRR